MYINTPLLSLYNNQQRNANPPEFYYQYQANRVKPMVRTLVKTMVRTIEWTHQVQFKSKFPSHGFLQGAHYHRRHHYIIGRCLSGPCFVIADAAGWYTVPMAQW